MINLVTKLRRSLPMYPAGSEIKQLLTAAADELEECQEALNTIKNWYDNDGSIGGILDIMDDIFNKT